MSDTFINKYTQDVLKELSSNCVIRIADEKLDGFDCSWYQIVDGEFKKCKKCDVGEAAHNIYILRSRGREYYDGNNPEVISKIKNSLNEYYDYNDELSQKLDKLFNFCVTNKSCVVNIFLKFDENNYHRIMFINGIRRDSFIDKHDYETYVKMITYDCIVHDPIKGVHILCDNQHKEEIKNITLEVIYNNHSKCNFIEKITPYFEYLTLKKVPIWIFEPNKMYDFPLNSSYVDTGIMVRSTDILNEQKSMRHLFATKNVEKISVKYNGNHYDILFEDIKIRYPVVDTLFKDIKPIVHGTRYARIFIENGIESVNAEII